MDVVTSVEGGKARVWLDGKLTVGASGELSSAVEALPREVCDVDIDLSGVDYVSSAGLRALAAAGKLAARRGGRLRLLSPVRSVREVFELTGFADVVGIE